MFGLFNKNPIKKMEKAHGAKLEEARNAQRAGNIQAYAALTEEAEKLRLEIEKQRHSE